MSDSDLIQLYSRRILGLAADIPHLGRLDPAQGTGYQRSTQCGSSVTATVRMQGDLVAEFAQEVRACALGQASAALLGQIMPGRSRDEIAAGLAALEDVLAGGAVPAAPYDMLEALTPAREFPNRHASIRLPWQALLSAIDDARN